MSINQGLQCKVKYGIPDSKAGVEQIRGRGWRRQKQFHLPEPAGRRRRRFLLRKTR